MMAKKILITSVGYYSFSYISIIRLYGVLEGEMGLFF
jgi:hypothetical protein